MSDNTQNPNAQGDPPAADDDDKRIYIVVTMSADLKSLLESHAKEENKPVTFIARRALAELVGYDLSNDPEPTRRRTHATEEDKEIAHRVASYKASQLRTLLVNQHKARIAKKDAEVQKLDAALLALNAPDWTPDDATMAKIRESVAKKLASKAP